MNGRNGNCGSKLYRDMKNAWLAGVCAGIADYFSIEVKWVRIAAVAASIIFSIVTVMLYVSAALFLTTKPDQLQSPEEEERYWRRYRRSPRDTMTETRTRFRKLEQKLRRAEAYMTSPKFKLDQEFAQLNRSGPNKAVRKFIDSFGNRQ